MFLDLFNYKESFLNPALKLIMPLIFLWGTYYAIRAKQRYPGEISKLMGALVVVGIMGVLAGTFRFLADFISVSWKWGESLGFLLFGLANLYAAWYAAGPMVKFIQRMLSEMDAAGSER